MAQAQKLSALFVKHAADILADTDSGLSGSQLVHELGAYAIEFGVQIPHPAYPFDAPNKRTALAENLMAFPERQCYRIIRELCDHRSIQERCPEEARKLKQKLVTTYGHLGDGSLDGDINEEIVEQTRSWLSDFPEVLGLFNQALEKYSARVLVRNLLDDLRLALEKLVQEVLGNSRSLENQLSGVGGFVKARGGSAEFSNMFVKLIDYYSKYQNTYVKHDDAVIGEEVEFIIEITSAFMRHFIRLWVKGKITD